MADVVLDSPAGTPGLRGYLARPSGTGPWPGVVVVHEVFGIDDVLRRQTDRMAEAGYLALAPDLFSRGGRACVVKVLRELRAQRGASVADLTAARDHLLAQPDCTGRTGIIGFCMGGAFALVMATRGFDVASDNYGALPSPLDESLTGACPIVASYGKRDALRSAAPKLTGALERLGVPNDVELYPKAGHSFLNDAPNGPRALRPVMKVLGIGPEPESARDAWARIDAFFARYLTDADAS